MQHCARHFATAAFQVRNPAIILLTPSPNTRLESL